MFLLRTFFFFLTRRVNIKESINHVIWSCHPPSCFNLFNPCSGIEMETVNDGGNKQQDLCQCGGGLVKHLFAGRGPESRSC